MAVACLDIVRREVADLTEDELDDLLKEMRRRQQALMGRGLDAETAAKQASQSVGNDLKLGAAIERRNAAINARIRAQALDFVRTQFADRPWEGITALIAGSNRVGVGTRDSADAVQAALKGEYLGGFIGDLERAGLFEVFKAGEMDQSVARALWDIDDPQAFNKHPKAARAIAAVVRKWQERARTDANAAGAWIGKLPGYIVRQGHDADKLLSAGFEAWRAAIEPRLDLWQMFPDGPIDAGELTRWLKEAHTGIVSGVHETLSTNAQAKMAGFRGPGNLAKKLSQARSLHFKSADDWFAYNQQFGTGNVREAVVLGLSRSAEATGLMRRLGTNPEDNLEGVIDVLRNDLRNEGRIDDLRRLDEKWQGFGKALLNEVAGKASASASRLLGTAGSVVRGINNLASLGGAVLSSVTDVPVRAAEMKYQGQSFLGAVLDGVLAPFSRLLESAESTAERKAMLAELGQYAESMTGILGARFAAADNVAGTMSKLQRLFFKISGLTSWTDIQRDAAILSTSANLGALADQGFEKLPRSTLRLLTQYGIGKSEWAALRKAGREYGGRTILSPEAVRQMPDEAFRGVASRKLREAKAAALAEVEAGKTTEAAALQRVDRLETSILRETRATVATKLQTLLTDRMNYAVVSPDARAQAVVHWNSQRGTLPGEIARAVMQFKAYPTGFLQRVIGREAFGYGARRFRDMRAEEMRGIARLILATTAFGYIAMTAKDLAKGKAPRDPSDWRTWAAAAQQGGGLGIYGDFLFGEASRFGQGPIATLAGPTVGKIEDLWNLVQRAKTGDDVGASAFRTVVNNTPFVNLFYTRLALDYLVLWEIQEALNPGSMRRMEQRLERETGQEYLLRPTEAVR
jgi:hypothetical protein